MRRRCLRSSGAVTSKALSWFVAWLLAFTADWRADRKTRIISTLPSALFGLSYRLAGLFPALAAASASTWVGFAVAPEMATLGSLHLHHRDPGGSRWRASPAP